jgi:hypothetical protein
MENIDTKIFMENKLWFFSTFLMAISIIYYKISDISPLKELILLSVVVFLIIVAMIKFIK